MAREEGQPLFRVQKTLVRLLQHVEKGLNKLRQREEGIRAFWGIDSINAFTMLVPCARGCCVERRTVHGGILYNAHVLPVRSYDRADETGCR